MGELPEGEEDVEVEKNRVLSGRDNDILILKYLSKVRLYFYWVNILLLFHEWFFFLVIKKM